MKFQNLIILFFSIVFSTANYDLSSIESLRKQANVLIENQDYNIALTVYLNILEQEEAIFDISNINLANSYNKILVFYLVSYFHSYFLQHDERFVICEVTLLWN